MTDPQVTPPVPDSEPDLTGMPLGEYHLLRRLGRGGMADVYLGQQDTLRRQVAIKVLKRHLANDPAWVQRFIHEAQSAASLVHGNIVQIHDVDCIDGLHFIVQEYVKGLNLRQFLNRNGAVGAALAVDILRQVAAALHKAAAEGIIHRDIKPENIMLSASGDVKVADFGLARAIRREDLNLTQVGMTMGTPLYMSPEQVEGNAVDQRSDIYSLGVTCYHMLAGQPPFDGESLLNVAVKHLRTEPRRLEELRPDVPIALCCIVHKMMAKDPNDRFEHALDLLSELRSVPVEGLEDGWPSGFDQWTSSGIRTVVGSESTQKLAAVMNSGPRHFGRSRRIWLGLAMAVVVGCCAGGMIAWVNAPEPLLQEQNDAPTVPRQENALEQYRYGTWAQSEEALLSVEKYFPLEADLAANERAVRQLNIRRAQQRLAELYLDRTDYEAAMPLFVELANVEQSAAPIRAFGLAGQAIVFWHRKDRARMEEKLDEVYPYRKQLSWSMRQTIDRLNRQRKNARPKNPAAEPTTRS